MRRTTTLLFLFAMYAALGSLMVNAQDDIKYGPNYVVFEADDTPSSMTHWAIREPGDPNYYVGADPEPEAINQNYIEYTGPWAAAASPLSYTFVAPSTGTYRLVMRMYQPLGPNDAGDQKNDVFIRMEGNYTSQTNTTKTELESNHKFWGRGVRKWGSCHKLEIGGTHMDARYGFIGGETYTLIVSGRSAGCSIDYILLFDVNLGLNVQIHTDPAAELPAQYLPHGADALSVTLDTAEINLINIGDTYQLTATVLPDTASDKSLTWESLDPSIATVDANGLVTAVSNGTTTVTALPNAGGSPGTVEVIVGEIIKQDVTWTASQLTTTQDIITDGTLLEAINFAGGTDASLHDVTVNTVPFEGAVSGNDDNNVWENPATEYFSANSVQVVPTFVDIYDPTIGSSDFDVLFSKFLWTNGVPTTVTFSNLVIGNTYKVQFLAADTRASQAGAYIVLEESFGSPTLTPYTESIGLSIVGEFTAVAESFSFLFSKVTASGAVQGINLNAYQLRQTATVSINSPTKQHGFSIFPNPTNDWVTIQTDDYVVDAEFTIYNLEGKAVQRGSLTGSAQQIDVSTYQPGAYLIQINTGSSVLREKLIIW